MKAQSRCDIAFHGILVINNNTGAFGMLMMSSRHMGPMRMFLFDKSKEIGRNIYFLNFLSLSKIMMLFFFWTVYKCNTIVKLLEEKDCKHFRT